MMLSRPQLVNLGVKNGVRDVSPSTRSSSGGSERRGSSGDELDVSGGSLSELLSEVERRGSGDELDVSAGSLSELLSEEDEETVTTSFPKESDLPPLQINVNIKNTFLNLSVSKDEQEVSAQRRRASSAPPGGGDGFSEELPCSPTASPRGRYEVLAGPVKECLTRFLKTMNEGSVEALSGLVQNCLSPEVVLQIEYCNNETCTGVADLRGSAQVMQFPAQLRDAIPDLTLCLEDIVNERRKGVNAISLARVTCTGTQRYPFLPMIPSGRHVSFALHMETLEKVDGKASRMRWSFSPMNPVLQMVKELAVQINASSTSSLALEDAAKVETATESVEEVKMPTATMQPILVMAPVFIPNVYAGFAPVPQQMMNQPTAALQQPEQGMLKQAAALHQEAQRAQLAAAALRAQIHLEALEERDSVQTNKIIGNKRNPSSSEGAVLPPTSMMLRNIPLDLTRNMFLSMLDSEGFAGKYDFVYLPRDFQTSANLGYAFVNLLAHDDAVQMQHHFGGFCRWSTRSQKKCEAVWSTTQGLAAHIDRFRNNPVMHESVPEDSKPMLFQEGARAAFPAPTRKLKAPRLKA